MLKNILFDFDGVIIDSMAVREFGFRKIFKQFPKEKIDKLIEFHYENGGMSRFLKIQHFFNQILGQNISDDEVLKYADKFSELMKNELVKKSYLISQTVDFIKNNYKKYNLHIVSGSEENELNFLVQKLDLKEYFISVHGSPTPKNILVQNLLKKNNYQQNETILIGDSINDFEASQFNNIKFIGFNNPELKKLGNYLENFKLMSSYCCC